MIRVVLPSNLQRLGNTQRVVEIEVQLPITIGSVLDALEFEYPMLRGTIRDQTTKKRRDFIRFFICGEDWSHEPKDATLPDLVAKGVEPLRIVGALAGG